MGICVGRSRPKHLEKTLATRTTLASSYAHRAQCELQRNDEVDGSAARASWRQYHAAYGECANWRDADFHGQCDRRDESKCELVGEWSCGRQCDNRNDRGIGALHCSGKFAESEHDYDRRVEYCELQRERDERRHVVERDADDYKCESGEFYCGCLYAFRDGQQFREWRTSDVRGCDGEHGFCFVYKTDGDGITIQRGNVWR